MKVIVNGQRQGSSIRREHANHSRHREERCTRTCQGLKPCILLRVCSMRLFACAPRVQRTCKGSFSPAVYVAWYVVCQVRAPSPGMKLLISPPALHGVAVPLGPICNNGVSVIGRAYIINNTYR